MSDPVFHRSGRIDARGYPVFVVGDELEDLIEYSPEYSPEILSALHTLAQSRCWVDLTFLSPPGADPQKSRDAVQQRLARGVRSISALTPVLGRALQFRTMLDGGRVVGRVVSEQRIISDFPPHVVSASFQHRAGSRY